METAIEIFSVANISAFDIYQWYIFVPMYAIAIALIMFPRLSTMWPFSGFSFLKGKGSINGIVCFGFVSLIAVPHFLITYYSLKAEKTALNTGDYEEVVAVFDGQQPGQKVGLSTFPERNLTFNGKQYDVAGFLHGSQSLLPKIRERLKKDNHYQLYVKDNIILKIEEF